MDLASLVISEVVLRQRSLRGAARRLSRPPSTVATALSRLEAALAVDLARRAGAELVLGLEAAAVLPALARIRTVAERLAATGDSPDPLAIAAQSKIPLALLERFVETVRAGSIRRAAIRLGIGQPQLTRQLRRLDGHFGGALLDRRPEGTVPTARGRDVNQAATEILTLWAELSRGAEPLYRRNQRTIRLGSIMPLGHESRIARLLADVLANWSSEQRRRHLTVASATAEDLITGLKAGSLDVALLDADAGAAGLDGRPLGASRLALVGGPGFLRGRSPEQVLVSDRVAVPSRRSGLRQAVMRLIGPTGSGSRTPPNFVEVDSIPVIVNLVLSHGYVSVLPHASAAAVGVPLEMVQLPAEYDLPLWVAWSSSEEARRVGLDLLERLQAADRVPGERP